MGQSTKMITAFKQKMTTLAVHDNAPLVAAGSEDQCLRIFADDDELLKDIRYHDGFMGRRIGSVASIAFHPHALFVAAGATDSIVSVRFFVAADLCAFLFSYCCSSSYRHLHVSLSPLLIPNCLKALQRRACERCSVEQDAFGRQKKVFASIKIAFVA